MRLRQQIIIGSVDGVDADELMRALEQFFPGFQPVQGNWVNGIPDHMIILERQRT